MASPPLVSPTQHGAFPPFPICHNLSCMFPICPMYSVLQRASKSQTPYEVTAQRADSATFTLSSPILFTQPRVTHSPAAPNGLALATPSVPGGPATPHIHLCCLLQHAHSCRAAFLLPHPEQELIKALSPLLAAQPQRWGTPGIHKCSAPAAFLSSQPLPGQPCSPSWLREAAAERRSAWPDVKGISLVLGHLMTGGGRIEMNSFHLSDAKWVQTHCFNIFFVIHFLQQRLKTWCFMCLWFYASKLLANWPIWNRQGSLVVLIQLFVSSPRWALALYEYWELICTFKWWFNCLIQQPLPFLIIKTLFFSDCVLMSCLPPARSHSRVSEQEWFQHNPTVTNLSCCSQ